MHTRDEFEGWALRATPQLFRYARLLIGDWHAAEDLVQDTLAKMYVVWPRIDPALQPTAYAKQTLFRLFASRRRRKATSEVLVEALPEAIGAAPDQATRIDLERALSGLKPAERAVIVARYVDGLPVREVAVLLARSEAWVRTTASRSLARLRTSPALVSPLPAVRTHP